jgi:trans-aconitate 2-methyltransferase
MPRNKASGNCDEWDVNRYERSGGFVWEYGEDVLCFLDPHPGERILDLGCGTGQLSAKIESYGADVLAIDSSISMITQARKNYPEITFAVIDATEMNLGPEFDAVFSNAALHWINRPSVVVANVWRALMPNGRFVAEFGGAGNIRSIVDAIQRAREKVGASVFIGNPWYFPTVEEYTSVLEKEGFSMIDACLFERQTPFDGGEDGMRNWLELFARPLMGDLIDDQRSRVIGLVEKELMSDMFRNGIWIGDYVRIRVRATK